MQAIISIGSNLGDRLALIGRAVALIQERLGAQAVTSAPYHSPAWGYRSPNPFINVITVVPVPNSLDPAHLLSILLSIERSISPLSHRRPDGSYADRLIDIDLIALGSVCCSTPRLTLPHPRMHLRPFVLEPLAQILPHWQHPQLHLTPAALLARIHGHTLSQAEAEQ